LPRQNARCEADELNCLNFQSMVYYTSDVVYLTLICTSEINSFAVQSNYSVPLLIGGLNVFNEYIPLLVNDQTFTIHKLYALNETLGRWKFNRCQTCYYYYF
jgi:hypothetical protein